MFEEYVPAIAMMLMVLMSIAMILLDAILLSMDRRCLASDVVSLKGATSAITACCVILCALFFAYVPISSSPNRHGYEGAPASERVSANDERSTGAVMPQTPAYGIVALPPGLSE
jgi:hypothetical protein